MEVLRGAEIATVPSTLAGRGQAVGRADRDRPRIVVFRTELQSQEVRLLEVIADELVPVPRRGARFEPVREALMLSRPDLLRQHLVCGIAQQHVVETERLFAWDVGYVGPDQVAPQELADPIRDVPRSGSGVRSRSAPR